MSRHRERRKAIIKLAAETAIKLPVKESGFWFHHDVRDNLYYAMHLFAVLQEEELDPGFDRDKAKALAVEMLMNVLSLQDRNPKSEMYSHWPLHLGEDPKQALPNTLPVELMGVLLAYFEWKYGRYMPSALKEELNITCQHIYHGNYYRKPVTHFNHHESKYVAQQLIWGERFHDPELLAEGRSHLKSLLTYNRNHGMREYGSLPWFWHWVQSFSCAWEMTDDNDTKDMLDEMLQFLWSERAQFYLKGAWAGAHSRVLPHDVPKDQNTLLDYIQFGDFAVPQQIARLEAAGLLAYEMPEDIRMTGVDRTHPTEVKKRVPFKSGQVDDQPLHSYAYITELYAVGGMWEYAEEYLNEQHRWDVTLPLNESEGVNQAFFFHPGAGYQEHDYRHASKFSEVLLHRHLVAALYPLTEASRAEIVGCLPNGEWICQDRLIAGKVGRTYLAVHLMQPYHWSKQSDHCCVHSEGLNNGVVIEAVTEEEAQRKGWDTTEQFANAASLALPRFNVKGNTLSLDYNGLHGDTITMRIQLDGTVIDRMVNGVPVDFSDYR